MNQSTAEMTEPRYGWVMVAVAGTFMAMAVGSMSSLAVFMKPLSAGMGWLRGETSFAYMAATLGVTTLAYLPFCFFNLVNPFIAASYGYANFKVAPAEEELHAAPIA